MTINRGREMEKDNLKEEAQVGGKVEETRMLGAGVIQSNDKR